MLQQHVEEYFKLKKAIREMGADIREAKKNHELADEIDALKKKLKEAKAHLSADELITDLQEEKDALRERFKLLKDIIKQELLEGEEDKVEYDGRVISLVQVMKEGKPKDDKSKKSKKKGKDKSDIKIDENVKVQ